MSGASSASIYLNGQFIDQIGASARAHIRCRGCGRRAASRSPCSWPTAPARPWRRYSRTVSTTPAAGPFPRLFAPNAFINTPIPQNPSIAGNSAAMVSQALTSYASNAGLANNAAVGHPDRQRRQPQRPLQRRLHQYGCSAQFGRQRIPGGAQPDTGSDGHLVVVQPDGKELDMWVGTAHRQRLGRRQPLRS